MPQGTNTPMHVVVSGSTGLVGTRLCRTLRERGHRVERLVRRRESTAADQIPYLPDEGWIDSDRLKGIDAVVNLAGEGIADGRWTEERKRRIRDSRVSTTRLLADAAARLEPRPSVLVNASAIGFYGDRGDEKLDETSPPGSGFLSDTCVAWEAEAERAAVAGIRVVKTRIGVVLSTEGGALAKMLPTFKLGLGGKLGNGRQFMSWISHRDVVGILVRAVEDARLEGAVNAVAPTPLRNEEFTRVLAGVLHRPAFLPAPAFAIRAAFGEMGNDLLLASTRVVPSRLERADHRFLDPDLESALRQELDRSE